MASKSDKRGSATKAMSTTNEIQPTVVAGQSENGVSSKANQDSRSKEEFDLHIAHLASLSSSFITNTGVTAGLLVTAIGWLATKDSISGFLANALGRWAAAGAVLATCTLYGVASRTVYISMGRTYGHLKVVNYLPERAFEERRPDLLAYVACILGIWFLGVLLVILLIAIK